MRSPLFPLIIVMGYGSVGCTSIQRLHDSIPAEVRRDIAATGKTVVAAYTSLLTTMTVHELGHYESNVALGLRPCALTIHSRFFEVWNLAHADKNGDNIGWDIDYTEEHDADKISSTKVPNIIPTDIHSGLAGLNATQNIFFHTNAALQAHTLRGRYWHGLALFSGLDPILYSLREFRNTRHYLLPWERCSSRDRFSTDGDLISYQRLRGKGNAEDLLRMGLFDLVGKAPEFWWHFQGLFGYDAPPPRWWHVGQWTIRPGAVIVPHDVGYGIIISRPF